MLARIGYRGGEQVLIYTHRPIVSGLAGNTMRLASLRLALANGRIAMQVKIKTRDPFKDF